MYEGNYAGRSDIYLNSCLRTEIPGISLPDGRRESSDFVPIVRDPSPLKKNIGLLAKKRISMKVRIKGQFASTKTGRSTDAGGLVSSGTEEDCGSGAFEKRTIPN